jgi:beta-phosphoglucomutase-like phosphatase (HAD superfamily)
MALAALQAVVFDFDGVLADTEPLHLLAFQEALARTRVHLTEREYFDRYLGFDDRGVLTALSRDRGLEWTEDDVSRLVAAKGECFRVHASTAQVLFAGVAPRLRDWADRVPIAIASGAFRHEIECVLEAGGLAGVVPVIVGAGETARGKPAPDPYCLALDLLARRVAGLRSDRSVAVEDSAWGLASAREAGMKTVAVATSSPPDRLSLADLVVPAFETLSLDLLDEVAGR